MINGWFGAMRKYIEMMHGFVNIDGDVIFNAMNGCRNFQTRQIDLDFMEKIYQVSSIEDLKANISVAKREKKTKTVS